MALAVDMQDKYGQYELRNYVMKVRERWVRWHKLQDIKELRLIFASLLGVSRLSSEDFDDLQQDLLPAIEVDISYTEPSTETMVVETVQLVKKIWRYTEEPIFELRVNGKQHAFRAIFFYIDVSDGCFDVYVSAFTKSRQNDPTNYFADLCSEAYHVYGRNSSKYLEQFLRGNIL